LYHAEVQNDGSQFTTYVKKAAMNKILNEIKRLKHLSSLDGVDMQASAEDSSGVDARVDIEAILSKLPPKQAEVIRLRYLESKTEAQIANELCVSA
jgi:RNA polymerase sigma factor (sigma-70 family)